MNKLLFIRLALIVFLMGPMLSFAGTETTSNNIGITVGKQIDQTTNACPARNIQNVIKLIYTGISFTTRILFNYVCDTLVATGNLVIRVVGCVFLTVGSVLANNVAK